MNKWIIQVHFFTTNKISMNYKWTSKKLTTTQNRITNKFSIFSHNKWTPKKSNTTQVPKIIPTSSIFKRVSENNIKIQFFSRKKKDENVTESRERKDEVERNNVVAGVFVCERIVRWILRKLWIVWWCGWLEIEVGLIFYI